jgi:NDP-sugar pyrophosphorylase family protein
VLAPVNNPQAYGLVETESDGRIRRFLEKPKPDEITCNTINAGTYILEPKVLDFLPAGENYSFEYGLFPDLLKRSEPFYAHIPARTYWIDIGTPQRYLKVHSDLLANKVGRIHIKERRGNFDSATVAEIDELSIIGDDCQIKPGAKIINSVLGPGCFVEERAVIENSVIWPHTRVGTAAEISSAIIGRGCYIGRSATVRAGSVLGDKCSLTDYTLTGDVA